MAEMLKLHACSGYWQEEDGTKILFRLTREGSEPM